MEAARAAGACTLFVVGPTASGKSALALDVAELLGAEVLSADARQVYRGMDVGTAKTPLGARRGIVHHLLDVVDPDQRFTLADYLGLARPVLEAARAADRPLVVVGGTGLYIDALLHGYQLPPGDDGTARAQLASVSLGELLEELDQLDPAEGQRVERGNRRRVERSLAYLRATGSALGAQMARRGRLDRSIVLGLEVDPATLRERIAARVRSMLEQGLVREVQQLVERYGAAAPGLQAIGYRELLPVVAGRGSTEAAARTIATRTSQYAKRQRTWFRRDAEIVWMRPD